MEVFLVKARMERRWGDSRGKVLKVPCKVVNPTDEVVFVDPWIRVDPPEN